LVDAPCSGLGVLSKKPDIKWKREPKDIYELQTLQLELLEKASEYVKPNGVLIYSTCTIENDENIDVVRKFLELHSDYFIDDAKKYLPADVVGTSGCMELYPHIHNTDGAFGTRLIRKA